MTGIIGRHRAQIGSPWRNLGPAQQALLVLACLRKGETFVEPAAGFGIGTATAWRCATQTIALLAARPPKLGNALRQARRPGTRTWSSTARAEDHDQADPLSREA
jgi:hypothetical protein